MKGELIDLNNAVIGAHQGFDGFKDHLREKKAKWSDISWNQNVTKFKYINHQGTLRNANRLVGMDELNFLRVAVNQGFVMFVYRKPRM